MSHLGQNTHAGFLPSSPTGDELLSMIGNKIGGWDEVNQSPAGVSTGQSKNEDLIKCYAQVYATPAGKKMIEDLLDQSIRRSPYPKNDNGELTLEQMATYGIERKGQNGLAIYMLSRIVQGQNLKPQTAKKKKGE